MFAAPHVVLLERDENKSHVMTTGGRVLRVEFYHVFTFHFHSRARLFGVLTCMFMLFMHKDWIIKLQTSRARILIESMYHNRMHRYLYNKNK
jgi:hypothetical protein